jgi:A/G-specific adenine glycosylase
MEDDIINIRDAVTKWYMIHGRYFLWRVNITPYKILIAELMLRRTRAEQVVPVYKEFINRYPVIGELAEAEIGDITPYVDKLGLRWRASNFIDAANYIIDNYKSVIPDKRDELIKIPGVGEYVAGAILTCAFNRSEYIIDSNIARFFNRYYDLELKGEIRRNKKIRKLAIELYNTNNTGDITFAILDFTAMVCKPLKPECIDCPLNAACNFDKKHI